MTFMACFGTRGTQVAHPERPRQIVARLCPSCIEKKAVILNLSSESMCALHGLITHRPSTPPRTCSVESPPWAPRPVLPERETPCAARSLACVDGDVMSARLIDDGPEAIADMVEFMARNRNHDRSSPEPACARTARAPARRRRRNPGAYLVAGRWSMCGRSLTQRCGLCHRSGGSLRHLRVPQLEGEPLAHLAPDRPGGFRDTRCVLALAALCAR